MEQEREYEGKDTAAETVAAVEDVHEEARLYGDEHVAAKARAMRVETVYERVYAAEAKKVARRWW